MIESELNWLNLRFEKGKSNLKRVFYKYLVFSQLFSLKYPQL